jgi:hypothetical protein
LPELKKLNERGSRHGRPCQSGWAGRADAGGAAELTKMVQAFAKIIEAAELEERVRKTGRGD